jgi:hypothetical protein
VLENSGWKYKIRIPGEVYLVSSLTHNIKEITALLHFFLSISSTNSWVQFLQFYDSVKFMPKDFCQDGPSIMKFLHFSASLSTEFRVADVFISNSHWSWPLFKDGLCANVLDTICRGKWLLGKNTIIMRISDW